MTAHLRANLWLLVLSVLLCSVLYPLALLGIGQTVFHEQAEGSLVKDAAGKTIGSRLIAQPFTADEHFQPRPSAASYNAAASGASNWSASNYLLRDRVARQLGPIVKYQSGSKKGQPVGPHIESWFQKDQFDGKPGIVAQWAAAHSAVAQNWVKNDMTGDKYGLNGQYIAAWRKTHANEVEQWKKDNPDTSEPKPEDLAVVFFTSFSKEHPGMFPSQVDVKTKDAKTGAETTEKRIEPVKEGTDIQAAFFDMWLQEHRDANLERIPADMVMTSGSPRPEHHPQQRLVAIGPRRRGLGEKDRPERSGGPQRDRRDAAAKEPIAPGRTGRRAADQCFGDEPRPARAIPETVSTAGRRTRDIRTPSAVRRRTRDIKRPRSLARPPREL